MTSEKRLTSLPVCGRLLLPALLAAALLQLTACSPSNDSTARAVGSSQASGNEADNSQGNFASEDSPVEKIADEFLSAYLDRHPSTGTWYSLPGADHSRVFDNSAKAREKWQQKEDDWLDELINLGRPEEIGSRDWVTYGILREKLEASIEARLCRRELWSAGTVRSWHGRLPGLFELQPVSTAEEREQAVDRLADLARFITTEIENLKQGLELGFSAPRVTVEPVIDEVLTLLDEETPLLSPARRAGDPDFTIQLEKTFREIAAPAVQRYVDFLREEYIPAARDSLGLEEHPDGLECYDRLVRSFATISPTAAEIHQVGLEQMDVIREEMQAIINEHYPEFDSIPAFMKALTSDPRFTFETEEEVLQYSLDAVDAAREAMPRAFGLLPRADVEIKPYPPHRASGTGEYWSSSEDGSRPGIYYIAVVNPRGRSIAVQQSVLYHETYPGHHLQGAIALELGGKVHPIARYLWNSGYGEGWGLYSERLADELGLYSSPLDRMGMLSDQAARAARLVIDTGLHTMGWTREQAEDYMLAYTAWAPVDIESEILRYIADPGQATSYMLGMLEIRRLRELAEETQIERFKLAHFHDRVLENGAVTLPMLDEAIRHWLGIKGETSKPAAIPENVDARILAIHERHVFADMHAHPSRFHRANVDGIEAEEVEIYRKSHMDLVVANISTDMAYDGLYWNRDGSKIDKGRYKPEPGSVFSLTEDRMLRLRDTVDAGLAIHASSPEAVLEGRKDGRLAIMPALEGADALEGDIENLYRLHELGLGLIQLVHFRNNELGHHQTWPYSPGGLTEFGREVVRESNRLGLIIDLAHCNAETFADALELSEHPVVFSHGGLHALLNHDRSLTDDQLRALAENGGVVGIWPHGTRIPDVATMVDYIEHVIDVVGPDHVGIGSDLRGISNYTDGFSSEAEFRAIAMELLERGHDDDTVGKVMGGNFFRVFRAVMPPGANASE